MKSLANIFGNLISPGSAYDDGAPRPAIYERFPRHHVRPGEVIDFFPEYGSHFRHHDQHPEFIEVAQKPTQHHTPAHAPHQQTKEPSEQEMRDYLASLAKAYDLPVDFVHAVAETESSFHPKKVNHNPPRVAKNGRHLPATTDYGLMQIDSSKIGHSSTSAPQGNKFKIGEDVKHDWKANARAGVAILAEEYKVAELEQHPMTSEQDRAQQAYSGYNGGHGNRDRYLQEKRDGLPQDKNDRHFLENYRKEKAKE